MTVVCGPVCMRVRTFRASVESIAMLRTAVESTTLLFELIHAHSGELCGAVVLSGIVVHFVDGDGGMHNLGLDDLFVDHRLDSLVDVVVNMFALDDGRVALRLRGTSHDALVLKLARLGSQSLLRVVMVAMIKLAMLDGTDIVVVLFREDLLIVNRLDDGVVVILVDLLVDSGVNLFMASWLHNLMLDVRSDLLMDRGVVVVGLMEEVIDG